MKYLDSFFKNGKSFGKHAILVGLSSFILASGCGGGKKPTTPEPNPSGNELSENTFVLSEGNKPYSYNLNTGEMIFSNPVSFSEGDIIASDTSGIVPYGFLREVATISNDKKTIQTELSNLENAIKECSFSNTTELLPSGMFKSASGVFAEPFNPDSYKFGVNFSKIIWDSDGNPNTTNDQVKAVGYAKFDLSLNFDLKIKDNSITNLVFKGIIKDESKVEVFSNLSKTIHEEFEVGAYSLKPIIFWISGLPVVIIPKINVNVGADGNFNYDFNAAVTQTAILEVGVSYSNSKWSPIGSVSNSFTFSEPTQSGSAALTVYAGPELKVELYEFAGANAEAYGNLRAEITLDSWELFGGLEGFVGVEAEIFGESLFDQSKQVIDYEKLLAQGGSGSTLEARLIATPDNGTAPLEVLLDASGSTPKDEIVEYKFDRDGNGSFEYTETSANHPDGVFDGKTTYTYNNSGTYLPKVIVKDNQGETDSASDSVIVYQLNTITIQPGPTEGKDAYVGLSVWPDGDSTYSGYGETQELKVLYDFWGSPRRGTADETLIQFPLSLIPSNAEIVSAEIKLHGYGVSNYSNYDPIFAIKEIINSWNESTVKWNTKPSYGNHISDCTLKGEMKWYEWDVTSLVQEWVNGQPNYGVSVLTTGNEESGEFKSSDYSDPSKRPKLEVVYYQTY